MVATLRAREDIPNRVTEKDTLRQPQSFYHLTAA